MKSSSVVTNVQTQGERVVMPAELVSSEQTFLSAEEIAEKELKEIDEGALNLDDLPPEVEAAIQDATIPEDAILVAQAETGAAAAGAGAGGGAAAGGVGSQIASFLATPVGLGTAAVAAGGVGYAVADDDGGGGSTAAAPIEPATTFSFSSSPGNGFTADLTGTDDAELYKIAFATSTSADSWNLTIDAAGGNDTIIVDIDAYDFESNYFELYGGAGKDTIDLDFAVTTDSGFYSNDFYLYGGDGADTLSLDFGVTGTSYLYDFESNYVEMYGDAGDDNIHFGYNMTDISVTDYVSYNEIYQYGGTGNDTLDIDFNCGFQTDSTIEYNYWEQNGDAGDDNINFAWSIQANTYSTCEYNEAYQYGGDGNDTMVMDLDFTDMYYSFYSNTFYLQGDAGNDTLTIDMDIAEDTTDNTIYSNEYTLDGGDGVDTLTFDMRGSAEDVYSNDVSMYGGAGDDTLNFTLDVSATCCNTQNLYVDGGAGAYTLNLSIDNTTNLYFDIELAYNDLADLGDTVNGASDLDNATSVDLYMYFENSAFATSLATGVLAAANFVSGADAVAVDAHENARS